MLFRCTKADIVIRLQDGGNVQAAEKPFQKGSWENQRNRPQNPNEKKQ